MDSTDSAVLLLVLPTEGLVLRNYKMSVPNPVQNPGLVQKQEEAKAEVHMQQ
jgi:hypothetical protein